MEVEGQITYEDTGSGKDGRTEQGDQIATVKVTFGGRGFFHALLPKQNGLEEVL
ncbi:hypothetical protein SDC9_151232 [bioreactor metagenome]|uniref:Uncharacterized protein n=1 Tax=bioreactor metagenome TaxID=1076179 RepID=A0A645ERC0_9ZZZZ